MNMKKEICTISLSKGCFDNDYTFFSDGTVTQLCDKHYTKTDINTEHIASNLPPEIKKRLIEKCPVEKVDSIVNIMSSK